LARRIHFKDDVATPLAVEDAANGFCAPPVCETLLLEEGTRLISARLKD
jgi:hypothetical protein